MSRPGKNAQRQQYGARERILREAAAGSAAGRESTVLFLLAIVAFLLIASISLRQATDPGRATIVLGNAVASTTEIDVLLHEHLTDMKRAAQSGRSDLVALPGFPIEVYLSRDEAARLDEPSVRDLLLRRAGTLVYAEGLKAFDRTGNQELGIFSVQGQMDLVIDGLTANTHDRSGWAIAALALAAAALAVAALLLADGYSGFSKLGIAVAASSGFGLLLSGLAWFGAGWIGGADPFVSDLRDIVRTLDAIPLRNYLIVAVSGGLVAVIGLVAGTVSRAAGLEDGELPASARPSEESEN